MMGLDLAVSAWAAHPRPNQIWGSPSLPLPRMSDIKEVDNHAHLVKLTGS